MLFCKNGNYLFISVIDILIVLLLYYRHRLQCWYHCLGKNSTEISGQICSFLHLWKCWLSSSSPQASAAQPNHDDHQHRHHYHDLQVKDPGCRALISLTPEQQERAETIHGFVQVTNNLSHCDHFWTGLVVPQPTCSSKRSEMGNLTEVRLTQTSAGSLPQCRRRDPYPSSLLWVCCQLWR